VTEGGEVKIDRDAVYTLEEVAQMMHVGVGAVRKWVRDGRLRAARPGKRYLVLGSVLLAFLEGGAAAPVEARPEAKPAIGGAGRGDVRVSKKVVKSAAPVGSLVPRVIGL